MLLKAKNAATRLTFVRGFFKKSLWDLLSAGFSTYAYITLFHESKGRHIWQ